MRKLPQIATALLILFFWVHLFQQLREMGQHDFLPFYLGAKLARAGEIASLYAEPAYQPLIAQMRSEGVRMSPYDAHYFIRPAFEAFFYVPFTWLPFREASLVSLAINFLFLGLLVWKLPVWFGTASGIRPLIRLALAAFYPFLWSISVGQDTLLLTLLVAGALVLESRGHSAAAGVALGLCAWKPHIVGLLPLALIAARRFRMAAFTIGVASSLLGLSFALVGLAGFRQWVALVQSPSSDIKPYEMGNLRAVEIHFGPWMAAVAVGVLLVCCYLIGRRGSFHEKFSAAIIAALMVSPHTYWQDYSLVAIIALLTDSPTIRILLLLPWPFLYAGKDELPMVFVVLVCLSLMTARALGLRIPWEKRNAEGAPSL